MAESIVSPTKGFSQDFLIIDLPNTDDNITIESIDGVLYLKKGSEDSVALISDNVKIENLQFYSYSDNGQVENIKIDFTSSYKYIDSKDFEYSFPVSTSISTRL
jgi:hypothetical protein